VDRDTWLTNASIDQLYKERDNLYDMLDRRYIVKIQEDRDMIRSIVDDIVNTEVEIDRRKRHERQHD